MSKIAFYNVSSDEKALLSTYTKRLEVTAYSQHLTIKNLPSKQTEIVSVHVDSKVGADIIDSLPNLKLIITRTAGFDHIDLKAATKAGVLVVNCAGQNAISVAEFVFGLIISGYRYLPEAIRRGSALRFDLEDQAGRELYGKTLGIIGTGSIGAHVAQIANGFGMKILGYDERKNPDLTKQTGLRYVSMDKLASSSDIITLHVPAVKSTIKMVNKRFFSKTKPNLLLINTARGSVVDTQAVIEALEGKKLGLFIADVLEQEHRPNLVGSSQDRKIWALQKKLAKMPNVLLTPHTANATIESTERILAKTFEIINRFNRGQNIPSVN